MREYMSTWLYRGFVILLLLGVLCSQSLRTETNESSKIELKLDSINTKIEFMQRQIDSLQEIHPWKNPKKLSAASCKNGTFLGFVLWGTKNTNISSELRLALEAYQGPKVMITSLRRHWGTKSNHEHGKAVDMQLTTDLTDWLVSEEGQKWLENHSLKFYIEDVPKADSLWVYKKSDTFSKYVFENPNATGPHIHIEIV